MDESQWSGGSMTTITVFLNGHGMSERDPLGEPIVDDSFLLLFNPLPENVTFTLPGKAYGRMWEVVVDTADPLSAAHSRRKGIKADGRLDSTAQSLFVLRCRY
jgi:isoamylase